MLMILLREYQKYLKIKYNSRLKIIVENDFRKISVEKEIDSLKNI